MIQRREITSSYTKLVIDNVTCGIGVPVDYEFEGVYIRGKLYPSHDSEDIISINAELCGRCAKELKEWIGNETIFHNPTQPREAEIIRK